MDMERGFLPKAVMVECFNMASERSHLAFRMRLGGATYTAIGKHLGIRPTRARQLVIATAREAIRANPEMKDRILDSVRLKGPVRSWFPTTVSRSTAGGTKAA